MSTVIAYGFKLKTTDIFEIQNWLDEIKAKVLVKAREAKRAWMVNTCVHRLDKHWLEHGKPAPRIASDAFWEFQDRSDKATESDTMHDHRFDLTFSVTLMPMDGTVYGMIHTCNNWHHIVLRHRLVQPYPYWNNTDKPNGISQKKWDARGKEWDQVLNRDPLGRPSQCGMGIRILPSILMSDLKIDEIIRHQPSLQTRAERMTRDVVFREQVATMHKPNGDPFKSVHQAAGWLNTEEGKAAITEKAKEIMTKLPMRIIKEHLLYRELDF